MDKLKKQQIINDVTNFFKPKQWFNGAGFEQDTLIIAYNFYPAFEMKDIKEALLRIGTHFEMRDIRVILPGSQKDDVPSYIR